MPDVSYWADRGYGSTGVLRQPTAEAPGYGYGRAVGTPSLGTVAPGGGGPRRLYREAKIARAATAHLDTFGIAAGSTLLLPRQD